MTSRIFLILAGLFTGMWIQNAAATAGGFTYPALAFVALMLALASAGPSLYKDPTGRLEEAYRNWLDAWHQLQTGQDKDRFAAEQALTSAAHAIVVGANDRVVRSLLAAMNQSTPESVAQLVLDMRRSLRRAGMSLTAEHLRALLSPTPAATNGRPVVPRAASPASFLG
jgi:hypothetical protein